ncbi:hypothetical protein SELSPUOL_00319 [Selenomonas sputigena ATCC 35185]|uniref:Uncharacterized protein n=1 Tax=Selenomonas sputigena (strain ATCC 35185 / DSM 20758 / CCUG 44933 / VPI D19B-28) TaxID=546271 RepID=C9LS95_SELS3|nr:hypothetical protein SELSPUOL_00319 [Selenomonas sputigena ATCC 35185]
MRIFLRIYQAQNAWRRVPFQFDLLDFHGTINKRAGKTLFVPS